MRGPRIGRILFWICLVIGLGLGLYYAWVIDPVEFTNTSPDLLRSEHQRKWVELAALSYVVDGDMERAERRLDQVDGAVVESELKRLIEDGADGGRAAETMRALSSLAHHLDVETPAMLVYLNTPSPSTRVTPTPGPPTETATPTRTLSPSPSPELSTDTPTPRPTRFYPGETPTPVPLPPFMLAEREQICEPDGRLRIEVVVLDGEGEGIAGKAVWLTWSGGADRAVTGLKPGEGPGYADFWVEPGERYGVSVSELGMPQVSGLRIEPCPEGEVEGADAGEMVMGSWRIVLQRRPPTPTPTPTPTPSLTPTSTSTPTATQASDGDNGQS